MGIGYEYHRLDRSRAGRGPARRRADARRWPAVRPAGVPVNGTTGVPSQLTATDYDGTTPFTGGRRPPATFEGRAQAAVTAAFVIVPFAGLAVAVWLAWGHGLSLADVLLALAFYVLTGLGVSVGFHRLLTHRRSRRPARCGSRSRSPGR